MKPPKNSSNNSERDDQFYSVRIGEVVNHFKAMLHTQNHDLRQLRRVVWSVVFNVPNRSNKHCQNCYC